jgi:hypothetical protein
MFLRPYRVPHMEQGCDSVAHAPLVPHKKKHTLNYKNCASLTQIVWLTRVLFMDNSEVTPTPYIVFDVISVRISCVDIA